MNDLRQDVFVADEQAGDVETALQDLRSHVLGHMNANLNRGNQLAISAEKPIQLVHSYYRDNLANYRALAITNRADPAVIDQAEAVCAEQEIGARLGCVGDQAVSIGGTNYPRLDPLGKDLYVFDFHSPSWSPDVAGLSLVVFAVGILLLAARFVAGAAIKRITA